MVEKHRRAAHAAEGGAPPPEYPILFMKNPSAAIGHQEPIRLPTACEDDSPDSVNGSRSSLARSPR